jgi:uncharacterized protein involved in type VI secretion and phage assembly
MTAYWGKYRASVKDNADPMRLGRLTLQIPDVLGPVTSTWALPCFPVAGLKMGFFALPPVAATVWVEFERGNPDYPVWTGGRWDEAADVPPAALEAPPGRQNILLQTSGGTSLLITDTPGPSGGIVLTSPAGAKITVNDTGIYLDNGQGAKITLIGSVVAVNETALTVTSS